ncbi:hypothetical protein PTTG_12634 [Puccinia triticina 1-1 BBBD Race 1]|uniref:F-box domain-containing protein n=2 Tax=Puccinia triticina TaxID=208348 RepID=A0A180GTY0_PUCT1|nr:uncharacterized protein PtA15_11A470 [Puccinia triticina]OAV95839.1 hypothetical protein PTTG_12634 [Puccinia triticina 1-1 BBBD Race 1]WAQ89779.1 hypothetical protein PtA15_11A470 [Puccinia triticina]WAR59823.1 hypothetical protein PtB15_11B464 [Puccinia triticina]
MVGLSELPLELKGMIVHWATQIDCSYYSRVSGDGIIRFDIFSNGVAPRDSCIRTISQLDRVFFALCRPVLWKVFDLRKIPTTALGGFHGSETLTKKYLRTFTRDIKTEVVVFQQPFRELIVMDDCKQPPEFDRFFHIERILKEIDPAAMIDTFDLELVLNGRLLDGFLPTCSHPLTARLLTSFAHLKNVKHFRIVSPISFSLPENLLVQTIINMKILTSFSAENIGYEEATSHPENLGIKTGNSQERVTDDQTKQPTTTKLVEFLSNLKCLKSLRMYDSICVDHLWSEMTWQSSLREIVLRRCPNLSSLSLQRLSKKFHLSLRTVDVSTIGISEVEQIQTNYAPGYLWEILQRENTISFKKLRALKLVGINMGEHLLRSFQDSPKLRRVEIDSPNIRAQTLFNSIQQWPLLRELNCRIRGGSGSLDLIMYCLTQKVLLDESFY